MPRPRPTPSTSTAKRRIRKPRNEVVLVSRSVFCSICGISDRQLAVWEQEDLIAPARITATAGGAEALYDREAMRRARVIRTLAEDLEVNVPGIGVILRLLEQLSH